MDSSTASSSQIAQGVTYNDVDEIITYSVRICINYASQIGASFILLVVVLLLTAPEKRQTLVFAFNVASLLINVIRNINQCLFFTGPFWKAYAILTGDYSGIPRSAYDTSITSAVLTLFLVICLECSLVLQVRAVCSTMPQRLKYAIIFFSGLICLAVLGLHFAVTILNIKAINGTESFASFAWLVATMSYTLAGSICWFSAVFASKLGYALYQRRRMGLTQFGPMQVIFIMSCQTLFIPVIFFILASAIQETVPEITSQGLTVAVIFLPLSSMWASASTKGNNGGSTFSSMQRNYFGKASASASGTTSGQYSDKPSDTSHAVNVSATPAAERKTEGGDLMIHVDRFVDVSGDRV